MQQEKGKSTEENKILTISTKFTYTTKSATLPINTNKNLYTL